MAETIVKGVNENDKIRSDGKNLFGELEYSSVLLRKDRNGNLSLIKNKGIFTED